jgi:hypothetical protein
MVIDNLDIRDVAIGPDKADTELIVDADRVLTLTVPFERFERHAAAGEVGQFTGRIQQIKSSHGYPLDIAKSAAMLSPEDLLGFTATERNNQQDYCITQCVIRNAASQKNRRDKTIQSSKSSLIA